MRHRIAPLLLAVSLGLIGCEAELEPAETPETAASTPMITDPALVPATPSAVPTVPGVPATPAMPVVPAPTEPVSATSSAMEQARPLLEQASRYVQENKLDLAEQALDKLDGMKGSLPESMQQQISALRSAVKARKQGEQLQQGAGAVQDALGGLKQD